MNASSNTHTIVVEVAEAQLRPGTTDQQLRAGIDASNRFLSDCDGFISRTSLRDGNTWNDIVQRRDMPSAQAALVASETAAECAPFFDLLDLSNARMRHLSLVA